MRIGPIVVQVLGPPIQGVPGRNGFRDPVKGVPVTFSFKSLPSSDDEEGEKKDRDKDGQEEDGDGEDKLDDLGCGHLASPVEFRRSAQAAPSEV